MNFELNTKIAVIGLGYVGLPLAVEFGKKYHTIGYDINANRITELNRGFDSTLEMTPEDFDSANNLIFSSNDDDLKLCNFLIICVPTPVDRYNSPDFTHIVSASERVAANLNRGDIVIYESTVFPGATEEICVPVLEKFSGLKFNNEFFCGYSPERINPGDKERSISKIKKVTSGSTPETATKIDNLYKTIITAGTYKAETIKVAEAAKVIENTQRDLNIALMNELAILFNKLDIDTRAVLEAAGTKWNFLKFNPGLVGGHCIGVDPYYLTHKAKEVGYYPEIILAGRRLNDRMAEYISGEIIKLMAKKKIAVFGAKILVLGLAFKENCPDLRNTRVIHLIRELEKYSCKVDVFDPWIDKNESEKEYGIIPLNIIKKNTYDVVVIAVEHKEFKQMSAEDFRAFCKNPHVIYDVKSILAKNEADGRL